MQVNNDCIEIYFEDLTEDAKKKILEVFNAKSPDEYNWEIVPIAVVSIPERD